ncbi:MAG: hypothetical protein ACYCO3_12320 [Mycobacteriales bacterium]
MSQSSNTPDAEAAFAELGTLAVSSRPLTEILQRTADLTRGVIAASVEVLVTLIDGDKATTPVAITRWAVKRDEAQYEHGYGSCLDSARAGQLVRVDDMEEEAALDPACCGRPALGVAS